MTLDELIEKKTVKENSVDSMISSKLKTVAEQPGMVHKAKSLDELIDSRLQQPKEEAPSPPPVAPSPYKQLPGETPEEQFRLMQEYRGVPQQEIEAEIGGLQKDLPIKSMVEALTPTGPVEGYEPVGRIESALIRSADAYLKGVSLNWFELNTLVPELKPIMERYVNKDVVINPEDPWYQQLADRIKRDPAIVPLVVPYLSGYTEIATPLIRSVGALAAETAAPTAVKAIGTAAASGAMLGGAERPPEGTTPLKNAATTAVVFAGFTAGGLLLDKGVQLYQSKYGVVPKYNELREQLIRAVTEENVPQDRATAFVDNKLAEEIEKIGGPEKLSARIVKRAQKTASERLKSLLAGKEVSPISRPGVPSNYIKPTSVGDFVRDQSGSVSIETLVPGIEKLAEADIPGKVNVLRKVFTRFTGLDSETRQAFINFTEGNAILKENAAKEAVEMLGHIDEPTSEALYKHLQEPTKYPVPEGLENKKEQLEKLSQWSYYNANKGYLTTKKDLAKLEILAREGPSEATKSIENKVGIPYWPNNVINNLNFEKAKYEMKLANAVSEGAKITFQEKLNEINTSLESLEGVKYFHQITTPGTKKLGQVGRQATRMISKKPTGLLGRKYPTREAAKEAGREVASLQAAVADVIYQTNKTVMTDEFIKNINRNPEFSLPSGKAPNDWRRMDERIFPSGKYRKYHPSIADALNEITQTRISHGHDLLRWYEKANTGMKMIGFYNPLFMTRYNVSQGIVAAGPINLLKHAKEGYRIWKEKGDTYQERRRNGVYNNVFDYSKPITAIVEQMMEEGTKPSASKKVKEFVSVVFNPTELPKWLWKTSNEITWGLDELQRTITWAALRNNPRLKRNYSDFEIDELVNTFHAYSGAVPKRTREVLNWSWHTPTYKISMARSLLRMHTEPRALWPQLARYYTLKTLFTVALPFALNAWWEFEGKDKKARVEGYKIIVRSPRKEMEDVYSVSDPLLEMTKLTNREMRRTTEYNLSAGLAFLVNFVRGPLFKKKYPDMADKLNMYFKTGAPVVKEIVEWKKEDRDTYDKFAQLLGLAYIYQQNKKALPKDAYDITTKKVLQAMDLWFDWKKVLMLKEDQQEKRAYYRREKVNE